MMYKPDQKKLSKPPQNKEDFTKKTKGPYKYNNISINNSTLMCTNRDLTKLNNTQGVRL